MKIKSFLLALIILCNLFLSGCWDSKEINELAISICIGIDKTPNGYLLSQQILNPKAISTKKNVNESPVIVFSEEGKDIFEADRKINTHLPRRVFIAHIRTIVISEEVAKDGIKGILDLVLRFRQFRTDYYFVIARGTTARNVLSILTPLEPIPGISMFDSLKTVEKYWAPVKSMRIVELSNSVISVGKNPVITGLEITNSNAPSDSIDALKLNENTDRLRYTSLGAFRNDKLIGWLDQNESKGYDYIIGNVKNTAGYVEYKDIKVTFEGIQEKSKITAKLINGKPAIDVDINIDADIGNITGSLDISKEETVNKLSKIVASKITMLCNMAVDKTKNDLKTDIMGFGEAIHRRYPALWKEIKSDWNNQGYPNLPVNISVHVKINKLGQITKPFFMEGND